MQNAADLENLTLEMTKWRRQIHAHPETAYEEKNTSDLVASLLRSWDIDVHQGLAATGVVGTLKVGSSDKVIGLRADLDALDIHESNTFEHRSRIDGKMHACGHDGHTAMLLGAAKYLSESRNFDGTVRFIFQPAEENLAGARRMIEEGLFEKFPVDLVFGLHNMPLIPEGKIVLKPGAMGASADFFRIEVRGVGAHGAWPHKGVDPIAIGSELVMAFNHIVGRTIDPLESGVISVTKFHAGQSTNAIPEIAVLEGTTRALSPSVQDHIEESMRRVCKGIGDAHRADIIFDYDRRYPVLVNDEGATQFAAKVARKIVGPDNVLQDEPPIMGAEDFAWMLRERTGSYVWLGNGIEHQSGCALHNPGYDFNDAILPTGARYWIGLAETYLSQA